jgi:magnesium chelatase family protein
VVRERVLRARTAQSVRYGDARVTNASAPLALIEEHVALRPSSRALLGHAIENDSLSGRGMDRVLRVSRTLADLEGEIKVGDHHVAQALGLRLEQSQLRAVS